MVALRHEPSLLCARRAHRRRFFWASGSDSKVPWLLKKPWVLGRGQRRCESSARDRSTDESQPFEDQSVLEREDVERGARDRPPSLRQKPPIQLWCFCAAGAEPIRVLRIADEWDPARSRRKRKKGEIPHSALRAHFKNAVER